MKRTMKALWTALLLLSLTAATALSEEEPHTHTFTDWGIRSEPTCTSDGEKGRVCTVCGETETQGIPAKGHSFGGWVTRREPTCTESGEKVRLCSCGETETQGIAAKGHSFGGWVTRREPTCTESGEKVRLCSCGATEKETLNAKGHSFGEWVTRKEPTCTEDGEKVRLCSCGATEKETLNAKGHSFGEWVTRKEPTCTEDGEKVRLCSCGATEKETLPANGHSFGEWVTRKEPTCAEDGERVRLCSCGATEKETLPAKGHSFGEWVTRKEPTCAESGEKVRLCACGETEKETLGTLPHTESAVTGKAATCTETGLTEGKNCSVCGTVLVQQQTIPAKGHQYVITKVEPTTSSKGYTKHTCSVCGRSYKDQWRDPVQTAPQQQEREETVYRPKKRTAVVQEPVEIEGEYGGIVTNWEDVSEPYETSAETLFVQDDLLVIKAVPDTDEYSLRNLNLSAELLAQLKDEGISRIRFVVGDAALEFALDALETDDIALIAADLSQEPVNYVFTVDPEAVSPDGESGYFVRAALTTQEDEEADITAFVQDMALSVGEETVAIAESGVLAFDK